MSAENTSSHAMHKKVVEFFRLVPLAIFPMPEPANKVLSIPSTSTVEAALAMLSEQKILAAPVVDMSQPMSAPWEHRYIGTNIYFNLI